MRPSKAARIYWAMILVLAATSALLAASPTGAGLVPGGGAMPASPPVMAGVTFVLMLVLYGGLGWVGLRLSSRVGFAGIWDAGVANGQRLGVPLAAGAGLSVLFVVADVAFAPLHGLGRIPHPPFPASVGASLSAGIGEEVLFRLFFISFWVWLVSEVILRSRGRRAVFAGVTGASALAFTAAHFPAVMLLMGLDSLGDIPAWLAAELLLLNGSMSVLAAVFMKRWGILAAVGLHFWTDMGWHVAWGLAQGG